MTTLRTAAQQALEALKSVQDHRPNDETNAAITALRAALAQEGQEPVAWMSRGKERLEFSRPDTVYGSHTIPLYPHPSRREWQSLSDEEIKTAVEASADFWATSRGWITSVARAIEAKLKERNHG